ncbi:MAG TPA: hypothetical protein VJ747_17275 [Stellaceae bacterium]|nr:hypothetical protein [Stellaceae bacterium]
MPQRLAALTLAPSLLIGCATSGSDSCPPVPEYGQAFRAAAVAELWLLPPDSAIERMLADYAVMRMQSRACRRPDGGTL